MLQLIARFERVTLEISYASNWKATASKLIESACYQLSINIGLHRLETHISFYIKKTE